jgi:Uma2 family endonuclease
MNKRVSHKAGLRAPVGSSQTSAARKSRCVEEGELPSIRRRILAGVSGVRILDPSAVREFVRGRQAHDVARYDEVWEGVYVVPRLARNDHQDIVAGLLAILVNVVHLEGRGRVHPGANVSDRRQGWDQSFRCPDVVVVLPGSRAIDCTTHWFGGPDFLVEVRSPGDEKEEKIPFYERIGVRELLIIHRDTRQLRLYRHDDRKLRQIRPRAFRGGKWLVSNVVPLAFRRTGSQGSPGTEVERTDTESGRWTI